MPVPVPAKQPAHPVHKKTQVTTSLQDGNPLHSLTSTLPGSPYCASFGTREQWISSLPSWRRCKPRCIQDHAKGLSLAPSVEPIKEPSSSPLSVPPAHSDTDPNAIKIVSAMHYPELSPSQSQTPFADFIDRAMTTHPDLTQGYVYPALLTNPEVVIEHPPSVHKDAFPVTHQVITPTATAGYKKLAAPLSEWMVNFVWRACSTDLPLQPGFPCHTMTPYKSCPLSAPAYVASSVHSMLLSTLLQPSAVLLALWYITKLPISFVGTSGSNTTKEIKFRNFLFSDDTTVDRETQENSAPFKLIVLGCMLANKWLDDHTFSNRTWHTISNVPIDILNKLESSALDLFEYDLTVSTDQWSQWLSYLLAYHSSLCSSPHPQPISRPSTNPHSIVRKAIEEIIQAPAACNYDPSNPQPVFVNNNDQQRSKSEGEAVPQSPVDEVPEIDLDEDGPLREEYLPRRRLSGTAKNTARQQVAALDENWSRQKAVEIEKSLPPPAKWSPEGDEPILRDRNRVNSHYLAVQPPQLPIPFPIQVPLYPNLEYQANVTSSQWNRPNTMGLGYVIDVPMPPLHLPAPPAAPPLYNPFGITLLPVPPPAQSHPHSHSRSHSHTHTYDVDLSQQHSANANRMRSYSVDRSGCDPAMNAGCNFAPRTTIPSQESRWTTSRHPFPVYDYGYPTINHSTYTQYIPVDGINLNYQAPWLRA